VVPATVEGLARGLDEMLGGRTALAAMGMRLRAHVQEHYSWTSIVQKFVQAVQDAGFLQRSAKA
jgi:hypothetical protein